MTEEQWLRLKVLEHEKREAKAAYIESQQRFLDQMRACCVVKAGMTVLWKNGQQLKLFKVTEVSWNWVSDDIRRSVIDDGASLKGCPVLKDGSYGKEVTAHVGSWKLQEARERYREGS